MVDRWQQRTHDKILPLPLTGEGEPQQRVKVFADWIENNRNLYLPTYTVMYHATSAETPVLTEGLLPSTETRRRFENSDSGYVCLATHPQLAKGFGDLAYPDEPVVVYEVLVPLRRLEADAGQLRTRRAAGDKVGRGLAASLAHTGCARIRDSIPLWQIQPFDYDAFIAAENEMQAARHSLPAEESQAAKPGHFFVFGGDLFLLSYVDEKSYVLRELSQPSTYIDGSIEELEERIQAGRYTPVPAGEVKLDLLFGYQRGDAVHLGGEVCRLIDYTPDTVTVTAQGTQDLRSYPILEYTDLWWRDLLNTPITPFKSFSIIDRWRIRTPDPIVPLPSTDEGEPAQQIKTLKDFIESHSDHALEYTIMYHATSAEHPILSEGLRLNDDRYIYLSTTPRRAMEYGDQHYPGGCVVYEVLVPLNQLEADSVQLHALREAGAKVGRFLDSSLAFAGSARVQTAIPPWRIQPFDYEAYLANEVPAAQSTAPVEADAPTASLNVETKAGDYYVVGERLHLLTYLDDKRYALRRLDVPDEQIEGTAEEFAERVGAGRFTPAPPGEVEIKSLYGCDCGDAVHLGGKSYELIHFNPENVILSRWGSDENQDYSILDYTALWQQSLSDNITLSSKMAPFVLKYFRNRLKKPDALHRRLLEILCSPSYTRVQKIGALEEAYSNKESSYKLPGDLTVEIESRGFGLLFRCRSWVQVFTWANCTDHILAEIVANIIPPPPAPQQAQEDQGPQVGQYYQMEQNLYLLTAYSEEWFNLRYMQIRHASVFGLTFPKEAVRVEAPEPDTMLGYRRGDTVTLNGQQYEVSDFSAWSITVTGATGIPVTLTPLEFSAGTAEVQRAKSAMGASETVRRAIEAYLCEIPANQPEGQQGLVEYIQAAPDGDDGVANLIKQLYTPLTGHFIPSTGDIMRIEDKGYGLEFYISSRSSEDETVALTWEETASIITKLVRRGDYPLSTAAPKGPELEQEEMEDLIDLYFCGRLGDDEPGDTQDYIYSAFTDPKNSWRDKDTVASLKYAGVEQEYEINGVPIHVSGNGQGLRFSFPTMALDYDWPHVRGAIEQLILDEIYPGSEPQEDPYNIPGEDPPPSTLAVEHKETEEIAAAEPPPPVGQPKAGTSAHVQDLDDGNEAAALKAALTGRPPQTKKRGRPRQNQHNEDQLSLFDLLAPPMPDAYEDPEDLSSPDDEAFTLDVGERFFYQGKVYEVISYMDHGETVEVGDIEQLTNLNGFKIRDRLRVDSLAGVMRVQDSYTDGEISELVVEAVQRETSGDDAGDLKDQIEAASIVNRVNDEYNKKIMDDFHERSMGDGLNYRYSPEHDLYPGGAKTRFKNNIEAIRLLQELEQQGRLPVAEEQVTLARYAGWGGLANALTPGKTGWEKEYQEVRALLTEDEYSSAVESTITAYYTDQAVIAQMYRGLLRMGFRSGNILDPGMGVGNFYSALPDEMLASKLYGVEIDSLSGRIAQKLYPLANVQISPFERTEFTDSTFDLVIGNVPFNAVGINDRRYNKYNFRIHEYFIAKSLDLVRPGGLVAVIASKFLLDKATPNTREYIAQRAELLGAIRLPNNAFKAVAGTEATTDILFFRRRERDIVPTWEDNPWISVEQTADGVPVNSYFVEHPEMLLGRMIFDQSMYANEKTTACVPIEGEDLMERLALAVDSLPGDCYAEAAPEHWREGENRLPSIPADPDVKNYTYTLRDGRLYYRENSTMFLQPITGKKEERIRGLLAIREVLRDLIAFQTDTYNQEKYSPSAYDAEIKKRIAKLNERYDSFVKEYGYINERGNIIAFSRDADAPLLRSIEEPVRDADGTETGKWDKTAVFSKPTISIKKIPMVCNSADEALKLSLNMLGRLDLDYMAEHYAHSKDEIIAELGDRIFQNPEGYNGDPHLGWEVADAYLSGEVKEKLTAAILAAEDYPDRFSRNVSALRAVQPAPIPAQDISFQISSPWIPLEIYQQFMYETFGTAEVLKSGPNAIRIEFNGYTGSYHISCKNAEGSSVLATQTYGTDCANAYDIYEDCLNMRAVQVRDPVEYRDEKGDKKTRYVLNKRETILAREKQAKIKAEFERWLFRDSSRAAQIVKIYNDKFNTVRPRRYNGDDLILPDLSPEIKLRDHQREAIAHGIYGDGNLLIGHEVGAGKTFSAIVITHELKRIGAVNKPLIAVPNHIVGQWASEYMRLYPNANILVAAEGDFEKSKRRRFVSRVCTGDYDCIIMAHSSFELINLSRERQLETMGAEIDEITRAIEAEKTADGKRWTLKQMASFRKNLQDRYDRLYNESKKDDTITFEELGCDMLVVDEAHAYKNNFSFTKLRNVGGLSQSRSQRAMDMALKCQYINEISRGRGVVFLTGTPISNSMAELYVMQKYLQPQELQKRGLMLFDAWAATYGEITTALEITPEGRGYQMKTRFLRFNNLPELMAIFTQVADIKTADMLDLPDRPEVQGGGTQIIKVPSTEFQKQVMDWLVARAEAIRAGQVNSSEDNFLKLTMEARVAAVDPRILSPDAPDDDETKLVVCARDTAKVYHETAEKRLTQLVFCDTGTPNPDAEFTFYGAFRDVLLREGVKPEEIAFIHDYNTDAKKRKLYEQVRTGAVRILMGSTGKMGTGMNVQDLVIGIQHLDIPWRPSDLTQQDGRGLRQGNKNESIFIKSYVTEDTFDSYMWQTLENKQRCISQIMTGRSPLRSCEDIDPTTLQYAQFKALGISDPRIKEKMEIDNEVQRLQVLQAGWQSQQTDLERKIKRHYPKEIQRLETAIAKTKADAATYAENKPADFTIIVGGEVFDDRTKAGEKLLDLMSKLGREIASTMSVGFYAGFPISLHRTFGSAVELRLTGQFSYATEAGTSALGNISRIENCAEKIEWNIDGYQKSLAETKQYWKDAEKEAASPFEYEEQLAQLLERKAVIDAELEFQGIDDEPQDEVIDDSVENPDGGEVIKVAPSNPTEPPFALRGKPGRARHRETPSGDQQVQNYEKLLRLAGDIMVRASWYMRFEAENYDDLVLYAVDEDVVSIGHPREVNGKVYYDPEIQFEIVDECRAVPLSWRNDNIGVLRQTADYTPAEKADLDRFLSDWLDQIAEQPYELVEKRDTVEVVDLEDQPEGAETWACV